MALPLALLFGASSTPAQQIVVGPRVQVSPASGGWFPWYEVAADPEDPNNLIVCGSRWDAKENAFSGFVYATSDGGKIWRAALEDKNSAWVTEHSCAFGVDRKAFFVSEAAKVVDGVLQEPEVGTTRIFRSSDSGHTWAEATTTAWADYSVSVADSQPGPGRNQLYTFFNYFEFNTPPASKDQAEEIGSRIGVMTLKDGEGQVRGPIINSSMGSLRYRGSYPEKAFLLRDGFLLVLYLAAVKSESGLDDVVGAVRAERDPLTLNAPVTVARVAINKEGCYPSQFAATYDPLLDRVYLAYQEIQDGQCRFQLKTSVNGGRTWSQGQEIRLPRTTPPSFFAPAIAVNPRGVLGLLWREAPVADCWYFAASLDQGKTFTDAQSLSSCPDREPRSLTASDMSLVTSGSVRVASTASILASSPSRHVLGLQVVDHRNYVWRNAGSLEATTDGNFHPVWVETGHGEGQLRTATVTVGKLEEASRYSMPVRETDLKDVSEDLAILYGGDQRYDRSSGTLVVDVVLENRGKKAIRTPLLLKALTFSTDLGKLQIANARNAEPGPGAVWDLGKSLPNGMLQPGEKSLPYSLVFHVPSDAAPLREVEVLSMQLEALGCTVPPAKPR